MAIVANDGALHNTELAFALAKRIEGSAHALSYVVKCLARYAALEYACTSNKAMAACLSALVECDGKIDFELGIFAQKQAQRDRTLLRGDE